MSDDLRIRATRVDEELAEEFPGLCLYTTRVDARPRRRSPREVKDRLRDLSDRFSGPTVVNMRQQPIPWAYRVFFRQIGIDPDAKRTPPEEVALGRLTWGGFRSRNLVDDALTVAIAETSVAVFALDADRVGRGLGLRLAYPGERLGGGLDEADLDQLGGAMTVADMFESSAGSDVGRTEEASVDEGSTTEKDSPEDPRGRRMSEGQIVIADSSRSLAVLFGDVAEGRGVHPQTVRIMLCAVQVKGIPRIAIEEALWTAAEVLDEGQEAPGRR